MLAREESAASGPVVVMDVPSIDAALADRSSGSAAAPSSRKQPVGAMGFTAYVKDTEGNVVGLWETAR